MIKVRIPLSHNFFAVAKPKPELPPVTIAILVFIFIKKFNRLIVYSFQVSSYFLAQMGISKIENTPMFVLVFQLLWAVLFLKIVQNTANKHLATILLLWFVWIITSELL